MGRRAIGSGIAVIINAGSGSVGAPDEAVRVRERFHAQGIDPESCVCVQNKEIRQHAEEALQRGCWAVVAGGGDGTVSTVASVVAATDAALGVLPLGTLNHFAKDAGIPLDLDDAVATVAQGHTAVLDLGEVNGRTFINNSSLGLYPLIVQHREMHQRMGRSKWWAFFRGALTVLGWYPVLHVTLSAGEKTIIRKTPFLFVGNNEYKIDGLKLGTRSSMDAGALSVYMAHQVGRSGLLALVLRAMFGRIRDAEQLDIFSTEELQVDIRTHRTRVALDGEVVVMAPPLRFRCRKGGLRVLVPKREGDSS
ncbi:diacylglycerol kinase family protein [Geobacter sp. DSM 9736]|uniref:diacylglycerol/lipid kinase family protein n=1 Tax=Geobacter sp. DSM 9736 TaxID=1277350 RepID=UPI000B620774|nr:diacylglycerol kinase family protein [Geobacter sp. DSM 9736]SNB45825.1 Diacylglycerol kinase family enzyme [Geobacter sp. DSM 9736]